MSVLGSFLTWFEDQSLAVQVLATTGLFGGLFVLGVLTTGIGPALLVGAILVDHWWRG